MRYRLQVEQLENRLTPSKGGSLAPQGPPQDPNQVIVVALLKPQEQANRNIVITPNSNALAGQEKAAEHTSREIQLPAPTLAALNGPGPQGPPEDTGHEEIEVSFVTPPGDQGNHPTTHQISPDSHALQGLETAAEHAPWAES